MSYISPYAYDSYFSYACYDRCPPVCPNITYTTASSTTMVNNVVNGTTPLIPFPTGSTSIPVTSSPIINFLSTPTSNVGGITLNISNGQFTVPIAGRYLISGTVGFVLNATGSRELDIYKFDPITNVFTLLASDSRPANADSPTYITLTTFAELNINDKILFVASQNSGVTLTLTTDGRFIITRL